MQRQEEGNAGAGGRERQSQKEGHGRVRRKGMAESGGRAWQGKAVVRQRQEEGNAGAGGRKGRVRRKGMSWEEGPWQGRGKARVEARQGQRKG